MEKIEYNADRKTIYASILDANKINAFCDEIDLAEKTDDEIKRIVFSEKIPFEKTLKAIYNIRKHENVDEKLIKEEFERVNRIHDYCIKCEEEAKKEEVDD